MIFKHIEKGLNPKDDTYIFENDRVNAIFVGNGKTKSCYFKVYKSQYLIESFRYGLLIGIFIGFQHGVSRCSFTDLQTTDPKDLSPPPMQGKRYTMSEWVKK